MIQSKTDLKYYIIQDKKMNGIIEKSFSSKIKNTLFPDLTLKYLRFLRKSEYYYNNNSFVQYWFRYRLRKMGLKLGYSIPINVFGPGLSIPHRGTIVVNSKARIGANCRLHVCVNIGASGGNPNAPQIGNNVYIGPGAILFGDITIADNVTVGANATVNSSCEQQNVVLAGSPAKIVKEGYPCWLEFNNISL